MKDKILQEIKFGRQSILPRFIHKWWAHRRGKFWLLCPICLRPFGGHEQNPFDLRVGRSLGWMICRDPACTREAIILNRRHKDICAVLNVLFYKVPRVCEGDAAQNAQWWLSELNDKDICLDLTWDTECSQFIVSEPMTQKEREGFESV